MSAHSPRLIHKGNIYMSINSKTILKKRSCSLSLKRIKYHRVVSQKELNNIIYYIYIYIRIHNIYIYIYIHNIYIYIYIVVVFGPDKPELGVIPSGQENHSGAEHLNFPGGELNVIFLQSNISLKKKNQRPVFQFLV